MNFLVQEPTLVYIKTHISWTMLSIKARDIRISARDIPEISSWKSESVFETFYYQDPISRDENSNNKEFDYGSPLLSSSTII